MKILVLALLGLVVIGNCYGQVTFEKVAVDGVVKISTISTLTTVDQTTIPALKAQLAELNKQLAQVDINAQAQKDSINAQIKLVEDKIAGAKAAGVVEVTPVK